MRNFTRLLGFAFSAVLALPLCHSALAGEWGSSGGEFHRDLQNPWFVKSWLDVSYCLEMDAADISTSPEKIKDITRQAIEYWQREFHGRGELLGVGVQNFTLANNFPSEKCAGNEDVKIQFGYNTLAPEQMKSFTDHGEDPQDYVGVAVRTAYDKENLRGKGFVFISSDKGAHPYNHGVGVANNLWNHEGLLFRILQHEIGHVFGVAHTETGFMASDFPEYMVRNYLPYRTISKPAFFTPPTGLKFCDTSRGSILFAEGEMKCVGFRTDDNWKNFEIYGVNAAGEEFVVGKSVKSMRTSTQQQFPVKIFLPKEQLVFNALPGETVWKGPARMQFKLLAEVLLNDGKKMSLMIDLGQEAPEVFKVNGEAIERWL